MKVKHTNYVLKMSISSTLCSFKKLTSLPRGVSIINIRMQYIIKLLQDLFEIRCARLTFNHRINQLGVIYYLVGTYTVLLINLPCSKNKWFIKEEINTISTHKKNRD